MMPDVPVRAMQEACQGCARAGSKKCAKRMCAGARLLCTHVRATQDPCQLAKSKQDTSLRASAFVRCGKMRKIRRLRDQMPRGKQGSCQRRPVAASRWRTTTCEPGRRFWHGPCTCSAVTATRHDAGAPGALGLAGHSHGTVMRSLHQRTADGSNHATGGIGMEIRQSTEGTERPQKTRIEAVWSANENGDLVLTFPNALKALRTGEMVASASGKTASPVNVVVPKIYIDRADGTEAEFKTRFGLEVPTGSGAAVRF